MYTSVNHALEDIKPGNSILFGGKLKIKINIIDNFFAFNLNSFIFKWNKLVLKC